VEKKNRTGMLAEDSKSPLPVRLAQGGLESGVDSRLAPRPAWLLFPVRPASFIPAPKTPERAET